MAPTPACCPRPPLLVGFLTILWGMEGVVCVCDGGCTCVREGVGGMEGVVGMVWAGWSVWACVMGGLGVGGCMWVYGWGVVG